MAEQKARFLGGLDVALKEQMHTDIVVMPNDEGPGISTHRTILAIRSKVLRNMLDSDLCKIPPRDSIKLLDFNQEELKSFIEFLYNGNLKAPYNQLRALYIGADKYQISFLQQICRNRFIASISPGNVLGILELANIPSDTILKDAAINYIVNHWNEVVDPMTSKSFATANPALWLEITNAHEATFK